MSNVMPARRGRPPRTDAEWARDIQRRVEALESATTVRIGQWVFSVKDGDLIASTSSGVHVVVGRAEASTVSSRSAVEARGESTGPSTDAP